MSKKNLFLNLFIHFIIRIKYQQNDVFARESKFIWKLVEILELKKKKKTSFKLNMVFLIRMSSCSYFSLLLFYTPDFPECCWCLLWLIKNPGNIFYSEFQVNLIKKMKVTFILMSKIFPRFLIRQIHQQRLDNSSV